jgi:hypothetical protein
MKPESATSLSDIRMECSSEGEKNRIKFFIQKKYSILRVSYDSGLFCDFSFKKFFSGEHEADLLKIYRETIESKLLAQGIEVISSRNWQSSGIYLGIAQSIDPDALQKIMTSSEIKLQAIEQKKMSSDDLYALVSDIEAKHDLKDVLTQSVLNYSKQINQYAKTSLGYQFEVLFQAQQSEEENIGKNQKNILNHDS